MIAELTTMPESKLLYWSLTKTAGIVARTAPLETGALGCVLIVKFAGTPTPIACETVALL